jgi:hypothetical protein
LADPAQCSSNKIRHLPRLLQAARHAHRFIPI